MARGSGSANIVRLIAVLAVAGIAVSLLLTSFHYSEAAEGKFCSTAGGCETVNTSAYAMIGPVPVALLGFLGYAAVLVLAWLSTRSNAARRMAAPAVFGISLIGVLYSAYLTYLELYVIHAVCPWCVVSAVFMAGVFVLSIVEVRRLSTAAEA